MGNKIPVYYHPKMKDYDFGYGHPFRGDRFKDFTALLGRLGPKTKDKFEVTEPRAATEEELELIHSPSYIRSVRAMDGEGGGVLTMDTYVKKGMYDAARYIVGSALDAADLVLEGGKQAATLGGLHHAGYDSGEGFCIFNDVAICAEYLLRKGGLTKVAVLDTDAHAGNGTMDLFYDRKDVLFISTHQDPKTLYPGRCFSGDIGERFGKGHSVNIEMPPGSGEEEYRIAMEEVVRPIIESYEPEVIIRNGGSDPHFMDTLTDLDLSMKGFYDLGSALSDLCANLDAPLISMTVSGYGPHTVWGWMAMDQGCFGLDYQVEFKESERIKRIKPEESLRSNIETLRSKLKDMWRF